MATSAAAGLLGRQLKQMQSDKDIPGISCGLLENNVFEWEVMLMISDDCRYYGGTNVPSTLLLYSFTSRKPHVLGRLPTHLVTTTGGFFRAQLSFPPEYPLLPPKMKFEPTLFHPNSSSPPDDVYLTAERFSSSLLHWRSLHLHPAPS